MRFAPVMLALFILSFALPAFADAADQGTVRAVESYLNGITTLRARFTQSSSDGQVVSGDFALKRPGRLRFQYDKPVTDFIVADGHTIYYYDGQMKQTSNAPISKSLADFFLRKNLNLSGDLRVSDVKKQKGRILVTLVQAKDPLSGSLTLFINENPMQLTQWRVLDPQGLTTDVVLSNISVGGKLDSDLFVYRPPGLKQPNYNR